MGRFRKLGGRVGLKGSGSQGTQREGWRSGRDPGGTGSETPGHAKEQILVTLKRKTTELSIRLAVGERGQGQRECTALQALCLDTMIQPSGWR